MENVFTWLNDPKHSYKEGLKLLNTYSPQKVAFFASVESPELNSYHFRMLVASLKNVARVQVQRPIPVVESVISVKSIVSQMGTKPSFVKGGPVIVSNPLVDVKELPEDLQIKYLANKTLTQTIAREHVRMKAAVSDEVRKVLLEDIATMEQQRTDNWAAIDGWWKLNRDPVPVEPVVLDAKKIAAEALAKDARIKTLKINIARATKESKTLTGKKASSRTGKITAWVKELNELENDDN